MTTARIVLLIALLVPLLGRAQEAATGSTSTGTEVPVEDAPSPPPFLSVPPEKAPSRERALEERYPSLEVRMAVQIPLTLMGALAGGAAGLGGAELFGSQGRDKEDHRIAFSLVGGALGAAGATYAGGAILGMEGRFVHTLLGAGLGLAIPAAGFAMGVDSLNGYDNIGALVLLGLAGLACPIVAYELSHAEALKTKAPALSAATGPRVYPVFAATSDGGALGLAGRF